MKKKIIFFVFIIFVGMTGVLALDNYEKLYESKLGEDCYQGFSNLIETSDGNLLTVGQYSSKNFGIEHQGLSDAIIIKYDKIGNIIWKTNYSTPLIDFFTSVVEVNGYYYAAGYVTREDAKFTTATNLLLVKYDANGKEIWAKDYYVQGGDTIQALTTDGDSITAVGYTSSGYSPSSYRAIIANFSLDGELNDIVEDSDNELYSSIIYDGSDYIVGGASTNGSATLSKYSKLLEKTGDDVDTGFIGLVNKVFYSQGYYYVVGDEEDGSFIIKYTKAGEEIAKNTIANEDTVSLLNVIENQGKIYAIGYTNGKNFSSKTLTNVQGYDFLVVEYDTDLNLIDLKNFGTEKDDIAFGSLYQNNRLYFAGYVSTDKGCDVNSLCPNDWTGDRYGAVTNYMNVSGSTGLIANFSVYGLYNIYTKTEGKGNITVSSTSKSGEAVTFVITPEEGYVLGVVKVTDANGNVLTFTSNTFTMPSADVTIEATFLPENPNTKDIAIIVILFLAVIGGIVFIKNRKKLNALK